MYVRRVCIETLAKILILYSVISQLWTSWKLKVDKQDFFAFIRLIENTFESWKMALDEPKLVEEEEQVQETASSNNKRDDAPGYYKRPRFLRNIIPFDTADLSVNVIRERFLVPDQVREKSPAEKAGLKLGDSIVKINGKDATNMGLAEAEKEIKEAGETLQVAVTK